MKCAQPRNYAPNIYVQYMPACQCTVSVVSTRMPFMFAAWCQIFRWRSKRKRFSVALSLSVAMGKLKFIFRLAETENAAQALSHGLHLSERTWPFSGPYASDEEIRRDFKCVHTKWMDENIISLVHDRQVERRLLLLIFFFNQENSQQYSYI